MPRLQRPGANSDLIKNSEDRDCTARHVQWRDGLIEQAMEIDELPENDERLLKKPEIKRDEMGRRLRRSLARCSQLYRPTNPAVDWAQHHSFKNRLREFIAGVIASRKTTAMKRGMDG